MSEGSQERMPWALVIVLTVLLGSIGTLWISTLPGSLISAYDLGIVVCGMELTSAPFILVLITGLGRFLKGFRAKINSNLRIYCSDSKFLLHFNPLAVEYTYALLA
ncbi:MAG: hypothetical protein QXT96_05385, partial [Candidatus Bathyarchaeia archaeon]